MSPVTGLELDVDVDVAVRSADLRTSSLHIESCTIICDQVVACLGLEDAGLRVGEAPVGAAGKDFTCER